MKKTEIVNNSNPIIGIIGGNGRFGSWFRGVFEASGYEVLVASRRTTLTSKELAQRADIVIICVPVADTVYSIREVRDAVRKDALLCDFTSVKEIPLKEMLKAKSRCGVTGIHPLFGPLVPSLAGQTIVFCSGRDNAWTTFLKDFFINKGAQVVFSKAREHDRQMAIVQALTHFTNIIFAHTVQKQKGEVLQAYSTPVFRLQSILAGRVLGGSAELSADLIMENPLFKHVLADYQRLFASCATYIKKKDKRSFVKMFNSVASSMRAFIPVAQTKSVDLFALLDRQTTSLKQSTKMTFLKRGTKIAYLGPEGTFSHKAVQDIFLKKYTEVPSTTISGVFEKIIQQEVDLGVVPVENSTGGLIQETLDNLIRHPLHIVGSYELPIHLCLLARTSDASMIKIIKSHAQPFAQAKGWLRKNFPKAVLEPEASSVKAILSTTDPEVAFIADKEAAQTYGLTILAENIEDKKNNITQFYVIAKSEVAKISTSLNAQKTFLVLAVYDRPGVLRDILSVFADDNLNLSKLHSKISETDGWDYCFFVEVEAKPDDKKLKEALRKIKPYCSIVRVLGTT